MSLKAQRKKESTIAPLEGGAYMAVCVGIIDLGHQYSEKFKKSSPKVLFIFEIPSEQIEIEGEMKPRWISSAYTNSLGKKAKLKDMLISWRGKNFSDSELESFDLQTMLGTPAMVQVVQDEYEGAVYANIAGVSGIPKGLPAPKAIGELMAYDADNPSQEVFDKLPEWIQNKIKASDEYSDAHMVTATVDIDTTTGEVTLISGEEIPF